MANLSLRDQIFIKNPTLKIGDVAVLAQNFTWAFTPGFTPFTTSVTIPISLNDAMKAQENPVDIVLEYQGGVGRNNFERQNRHVIRECYLHEPQVISEFHVKWQISDKRFLLRGQKCFFNYNETRIQNDIAVVNPTQLKANIDTNPAALRAPFDNFPTARYVPPSIKDDESSFTLSEIVVIELAKKGFNAQLPSNIAQVDYKLENVRAEGEDFYVCMSSLLAKLRMSCFVDFDANLKLYSIDFFDLVSAQSLIDLGNKQKSDLGNLYLQDKTKVRPSKVTVRFEKMIETSISFVDVASEIRNGDGGDRRKIAKTEIVPSDFVTFQQGQQNTAISCTNVIQANFIPANFLGIYDLGEYIEIGEYLLMLGLSKDELRRSYFGDILAFRISALLTGDSVEGLALASAIANNLKESFRKLFMIDPHALDRIKIWEAKRVEIVDQFSGNRPTSPLYQDFFMVPRVRDIRGARGQTAANKAFTKSVFIDQFDPTRTKGGPGTIQIVNPELGVFRAVYPPVSDSVIYEVAASALEEDVLIDPTINGLFLQEQASLSQNHTMDTLVSVIWNYDPNDEFESSNIQSKENKYHDVEFDFSQGSNNFGVSKGPEALIMCKSEYARYNKNLDILNNDIVDALATAEAGKLMNKFRDRIGGYLELPDWIVFPLLGNLSSIVFSFSPQDGASTSFDATEPPFAPTIEQSIPDDVRQYMLRQIKPTNGP